MNNTAVSTPADDEVLSVPTVPLLEVFDEILDDEVELEDELDRARLPTTLRVTVNGAPLESLNRRFRAPEVSPEDSTESEPTRLL